MRRALSRIPLFVHLYRIWHDILMERLNRGSRVRLLLSYCNWYFYRKPRNQTTVITLQNGTQSIVHPDSDSGVANIFTKNVDYYENEFIRAALEDGDFVVDAGCNVGNRTLVLTDIISGALLIDANELCLRRLERHFALNRINMDNYHLCAKAVGDKQQEVVFTDLGGTSCLNRVADGRIVDRTRQVQMTTVDHELTLLGSPPCTYAKFDLEGFDLHGMRGATQTLLSPSIRLVKFERWRDLALVEFAAFFAGIGWKIFALDSTGRPTANSKIISRSSNLFASPCAVLDSLLG